MNRKKKAYNLSQEIRELFVTTKEKRVTLTKLAQWYNKVGKSGLKSFNTIMNTISLNYDGILNSFDKRSTNASGESFNAKIKAFRPQFRGVRNVAYILFRLTKIHA